MIESNLNVTDFFAGPLGLIAEQSASGKNSQSESFELLRQSVASGANAIKFQTYLAHEMTAKGIVPPIKHGLWKGRDLYDLYEAGQTDLSLQSDLIAYCEENSIPWFSSPFGSESLSFLESMGCSIYKIASLESTDIGFLREVASLRKPMIVSTGAKTINEITVIYDEVRSSLDSGFALMHCICDYPTTNESTNLAVIRQFNATFDCPIGFSDHSRSTIVGALARACGASIFEKHITLGEGEVGLDDGFALKPQEIAEYFANIKLADVMIGSKRGNKEFLSEKDNSAYRRGLYFARDIAEGEYLSESDLTSLRPCLGIDAINRDQIVGRRTRIKVCVGQPIDWSAVD